MKITLSMSKNKVNNIMPENIKNINATTRTPNMSALNKNLSKFNDVCVIENCFIC
jgi:hypothetical protein